MSRGRAGGPVAAGVSGGPPSSRLALAEDDGYAPAEVVPARQELAAAAARAGIDLLGPPGTFPNSNHF